MDPRFEVLPPGPPPARPKRGFGALVAALGVLALKFKTVLSMAFFIWAYSFRWGWLFAIGITLLIFVHEMGHVIAARLLGMPVTAPLFIPFVGAAITMKQNPRDAWTESLMAYGGPLAGMLGGIVVWWIALQWNIPWLMAVARANFLINLFNLIPLPPLDGGRICAAVSPWFWTLGLILFSFAFFVFQASTYFIILAVVILIVALPRLKQTFLQRNSPQMQAYYATHLSNRLIMALLYLCLIGAGLIGFWDANQHLQAYTNGY